MKLITTKNLKTLKSVAFGYANVILHLAPFNLSGKNVCPNASAGCAKACLNTSGHGRYQNVQNARIKRTLRYFNERQQFEADLSDDIKTVIRRAKKNDLIPVFRLNGTSDIPSLALNAVKQFAETQFYDYTKNFKTMEKFLKGELPANYHLTFSRSETNEQECKKVLELGGNVAVVFDVLPKTYLGYKVIDGDTNDLRFLDEKNVVVGLTAKGRAKKDKSGFVVRTNS